MDTRHTIVQYEQELQSLRTALVKMGELVVRQIPQAMESLTNRDFVKASETIARDIEVNKFDVEIDGRCVRLIALYQPTAVDLRLVTTGLKITTELERIGDNAVNICERVLELEESAQVTPPAELAPMAAVAQSMVGDSLDAFMRNDADLAETVIARDDEVDHLNHLIYGELLVSMTEEPHTIPVGARLLFIAKYLEKIADHACHIAEMVVFLVKGRTIRHMDKHRQ